MKFTEVIKGQISTSPPIWMMRQAGRYLPGYRALRAHHKDFLSLCLSPEAAHEVTLEPIKRFHLDAAIVFADILVIPMALGQPLVFKEGKGPLLGPLPPLESPFSLNSLAPILETLRLTRQALDPGKALIGFAGSPWTVLSYMIEGGSSKSFEKVKAFAYGSSLFQEWMNRLITAMTEYLIAQVKAGADVLMLFDSWAGQLPYDLIERCCLHPHQEILQRLRREVPHTPIITFPRHLHLEALKRFIELVSPDVLALSNLYSPETYAQSLPASLCLQLGPDPVLLKLGGKPLKERVRDIQKVFKGRPYIMNLAHGILPQTPLENVEKFIHWTRHL